jgi:hypothetical protein
MQYDDRAVGGRKMTVEFVSRVGAGFGRRLSLDLFAFDSQCDPQCASTVNVMTCRRCQLWLGVTLQLFVTRAERNPVIMAS